MKADNSLCVAFFVGTFIGTLAAALFWLVFLVLMTSPASAQDILPHEWITEGQYTARGTTAHCCDQKTHCRRLEPEQVETIDEDTWKLVETGEIFKRGDPGVYDSQDGRFWECHWSNERVGQRCFFHAGAGM